MRLFRRFPLVSLLLLLVPVASLRSEPPTGANAPTLRYFPPEHVRLLPGPFQEAQERVIAQVLAHDIDRLLAPFRQEAGLEPKAPRYPNWESSGLDGHTAGHYLTALAQLSVNTGHPEVRQRLDTMLQELRLVQEANGDGYIGGVPGGRAMWQKIARGDISADSFGLNGGWVPWYNLHKTFAGLFQAWNPTGHPAAKEMFLRLCDWCDRLVAGLTDEQMEIMLRTEHGGMAEVLAEAYALTAEARYLSLARRFSHRALLDPLLAREDTLTGLHANTQIPKATGFARIGELGGQPAWIEAAHFFWATVARDRSAAIGGNSVREHFHPSDDFTPMIESREGPETCNTYNMLRLTEQLFRLSPNSEYADFYERAIYNHILSTQHPEHGGFVYFTPMRPRDYRVYSQPEEGFWCCVGTGFENHGRYNRFIYAQQDERDLWVNLFIASELEWPARQLSLRQETDFPHREHSQLTLTLPEPATFTLHLRWPEWVAPGAFRVAVNGEPQTIAGEPSSYVALEREWRSGDVVTVHLPMRTELEPLPDGSPYVAVRHGPIVLGARTGTEDLRGLLAGDGRMAHIGTGALLPLDQAPMFVGDASAVLAAIEPVPGEPLTFTARGVIRPDAYTDLRLEPFYRIHDARYIVYWRHASVDEYPRIVQAMHEREQAAAALEARTLDRVVPGEQQPEVEHAYRGEEANTGVTLGRTWRSTSRWFEYELQGTPGRPMILQLTYWKGQWGRRAFAIYANDQTVAEVTLEPESSDHFGTLEFPLPDDVATSDGRVRVRFEAQPESTTGALYDVRLLRP